MSNRLKHVLPNIVSENQTCCKERDSIQKECINFLWKYGVHLLSHKTAVGD